MQPNEIIREYLHQELSKEDEQRSKNRKLVNSAVAKESKRLIVELEKNPEIVEERRAALSEFWEATYEAHGEDALNEMKNPNTGKAVELLEENLERGLQCAIHELEQNEQELINQFEENVGDGEEEEGEREETGDFNNREEEGNENEEEYEERNEGEENEEDQSEERYRTSEHPEEIHEGEEYAEEHEQDYQESHERGTNEGSRSPEKVIRRTTFQHPTSPPGQHFYPRYINKKDKMQLLMKHPAFVNAQVEIVSPISEKKIFEAKLDKHVHGSALTLEPFSNIPEEKNSRAVGEQRFIEEFDADVPRKLKVNMTSAIPPDFDDVGYPEPWYNKTRSDGTTKSAGTNKSPLSKNYPLEHNYDEKSYIKKNIDNYQTFEPDDANFFAQEVFSGLDIKPGFENDVILERLKQRYEAVYRDNFLIDRAEMRHTERTKRRPANLPETEFLTEDQIRENKLLSTLRSPENARDLAQLEPQSFSESFQEFKDIHSGRRIPPSNAKVEYLEEYRRSRARSRDRNSPERRRPVIWDEFELALVDLASNEARSQYQSINQGNEFSQASTHRSMFFSRPRKYQDANVVENFIVDLYRTMSSNNGTVPPKYQHKLQEILNLKPTVNKYYEGKKKQKQEAGLEGENEDRNSEQNLIQEALSIVSLELNNRTITILKLHPENTTRTLMWKCILSLQANFDQTIPLVNQRVVGKYDQVQQYISQPGKVALQLRALTKRLKTEEIKKTLYDDFRNFFFNLEDDLVKKPIDDPNERLLLRYIYYVKRLLDVLEREDNLTIINNAEQKIKTNTRMNQKYLENKERRRVDSGDPRLVSESSNQEMYGIHFGKWEENLKALEKENKLLVKFGEEKQRKEQKLNKMEEKKRQKEEELKTYEENLIKSRNDQAQREELRKQEKEFKSELINNRVKSMKERKQLNKAVQKDMLEENMKQTVEHIQYRNQLRQKAKEDLKEVQKERKTKLLEKKKEKKEEQQVNAKSEKEEEVWRKAQAFFEKQRNLLKEREKLQQQIKNLAK